MQSTEKQNWDWLEIKLIVVLINGRTYTNVNCSIKVSGTMYFFSGKNLVSDRPSLLSCILVIIPQCNVSDILVPGGRFLIKDGYIELTFMP